jgi:RHS repeat-associated protein
VAKGTITTWSCDPSANGFQTTSDDIIGPSNEQMTEMVMDPTTNSMVPAHNNVWAGSSLIATLDVDGLLHFYLNDPLGSRRVQTDYAGVLEQSCSSLPYGDQESCAPTPTEHLFTGKERDTESGNDYFGARYYSSTMGRFMSPDWSAKEDPVPYAKLDDPQSLNLYAYVRNNPLSRTDVDGHQEPQPPTITCTGTAYVLAGNSRNVGHEGAPGVTVTNGSAAVVPRQWTGADGMGPSLRTIGAGTTGTVTGSNGQKETFSTLTQPVGEATLGTAKQAQDTIMARAPGALVIEIVGGKDLGTKASVTLTMPNTGQGCPQGTTQVPTPKPAPAPPPPPVRPPAH